MQAIRPCQAHVTAKGVGDITSNERLANQKDEEKHESHINGKGSTTVAQCKGVSCVDSQ